MSCKNGVVPLQRDARASESTVCQLEFFNTVIKDNNQMPDQFNMIIIR